MNSETRELWATTPQGLVVSVKPDGSWGELRLAQNTLVGPPSGPDVRFVMAFAGVPPRLRSAFQANQQFLVVTSNANLGSFRNALGVGSRSQYWEFVADVGRGDASTDYRNVLIFKFADGPLGELIKDPALWTRPGDFNSEDPVAVSRWLQEYVGDGIRQARMDRNGPFENFSRTVQDPRWRGILALKVDIAKVPDGLTALLGGADETRFNAHHLGMEVTRVDRQPRVQMSGNSPVFGLIYYMDPVYLGQLGSGRSEDYPVPPAPGVASEFKVLTLQVLFENTRVARFHSKAQVTARKPFGHAVTGIEGVAAGISTLALTAGGQVMMNELFGDGVADAEGMPPRSDTLVLTGLYQNHAGQDVYVFDARG